MVRKVSVWPSCGDPFTLHSHLHPQPVLPSLHECLSAHNHGDFQVNLEGWAKASSPCHDMGSNSKGHETNQILSIQELVTLLI